MNTLLKSYVPEFTDINTSLYTDKKIRLRVARLDKIHPVISGNKLFKLHFFLEKALQSSHKTILTFGGAWSNHLLATAYACRLSGLHAIGIVRGERAGTLSHTLKECESYGMQLKFISRKEYGNKETASGEYLVIPEGGYDPLGAKGASLIMDALAAQKATHICSAVGTATTLAGLLQNRNHNEKIIGIPILKNMTDIQQRVAFLNGGDDSKDLILFDEYHFGGYAKKTKALLDFMNDMYNKKKLPTDFVYTGKMMYAVIDKINSGYFPDGSNIICLHTGGLHGNTSLPAGTLVF